MKRSAQVNRTHADDQGHPSTRAGARDSDWRFELLAEFEELVRSYGQDHVSRS